MPRISRRTFLAGSAASLAAPALHIDGAAAAEVDVVIVGAGAAGIAAARRVAAAKRSFRLFEASPRIGGRCITDTATFGVPFDLGAHWVRNSDNNPLLAASKAGLHIYPAARGQTLRVGPRPARDAEVETFLAALLRAQRAIADAARARTDMPAVRALPRDLGVWQATIEFVLGPYGFGKNLADISAMDLARVVDRDSESFCRQGYGALLASLANGLPVQLGTPVGAVAWGGRQLAVDTPKGNLLARAVIVTVPTNVLTRGKIEFMPALPKRQLDAAEKLSLGSLDYIALEIPGNPFGLQRDDLVFEQAKDARTAALLTNISGTPLNVLSVGGGFGRELAAKGEPAMIDFAREWLSMLFGASAARAIKRARATRWDAEPWIGGAIASAAPGAAEARKALMEPLGGKVWLAGEAAHETRWGTVNGAWESGTRAAEAALRRLGALKDGEGEKPARSRRRK